MNNEEGEKDKIITWRKKDNDNKPLNVNNNKKLKQTKVYTLKEKEYINKYSSISKNIISEEKLYNIITKYNFNEQLILTEIFYILDEEDIRGGDDDHPANNIKTKKQTFIPYKTKYGTLKTIYGLKKENKPIIKVLSKDKKVYKYENNKIFNRNNNDIDNSDNGGNNDKINDNNINDDSNKMNKNEFYPKRFSNFNKIIEDYKNKKYKENNNNFYKK